MSLKKIIYPALLLFLIAPAFALEKDSLDSFKLSTPAVYQILQMERVIDGDTFVASGFKIRLWGVNAPEKNEPLFETSAAALTLFLNGAKLRCKLIEFDPYKREVRHCFVDDADLGALMVKSGFAKDFKKYSGGFYQEEQKSAQAGKLGVWKDH